MSKIILITNPIGQIEQLVQYSNPETSKRLQSISQEINMSVIFRQNHQRTIINSSKNHKCVIQTDEKNHVNFHIKQMMHNNTSGQKQLRKILKDNSLHTSSLEMQSRHSHKCKPRFVKY